MWYSNAKALIAAGSILAAVPIIQASETPACPNGICPGLGRAFYLPATNLLDAKKNISGRAVFKDVRLGDCATLVDLKVNTYSFQTYESASKLTDTLNASINSEAGFPVKQVTVGATVEATTGRTSTQTQAFKSVVLNSRPCKIQLPAYADRNPIIGRPQACPPSFFNARSNWPIKHKKAGSSGPRAMARNSQRRL